MTKKIIPIFTIICVMLAAGIVFAKPENKTYENKKKRR